MSKPDMKKVLEEVAMERRSQDEHWGEQNHNPVEWLAILGEEVGKASQGANKAHHILGPYGSDYNQRLYRQKMINVAAVAVSAIESLDRNA